KARTAGRSAGGVRAMTVSMGSRASASSRCVDSRSNGRERDVRRSNTSEPKYCGTSTRGWRVCGMGGRRSGGAEAGEVEDVADPDGPARRYPLGQRTRPEAGGVLARAGVPLVGARVAPGHLGEVSGLEGAPGVVVVGGGEPVVRGLLEGPLPGAVGGGDD